MTSVSDAPTAPPAPPSGAGPIPIPHFGAAEGITTPGTRLRAVRQAAAEFRPWFAATGTPEYVGTFDLVTIPYPTRFGLWRAARTPSPYLWITNRLMVVRWREAGRQHTLLFEPSDVELGVRTPYFAALNARLPRRFEPHAVVRHAGVLEHLRRLGIGVEEIDYLIFDHLHTQDVRRWVGTTEPQSDISPTRPVEPAFPNARLVVQAAELAAIADLHPLQRPWYQPETYTHLRTEAILEINGDVMLGPGVALLSTPGHATGNQSLCLNTHSGIWVSSENVIAAELLTPEHSAIPGVRRWALETAQEVVLNANTLEDTAEQYNSAVKEKAVADRSARDPRFVQFFPSSELTPWRFSPGTRPTFSHLGIGHGALR